jgi:hypothetical protein
MDEPFIDDRHRISCLLDEENRAVHVDLVRRADRLLHERQVSSDDAPDGASRHDAARQLASEPTRRTWGREGGEKRRHRWIATARNQIVDGRSVKAAEVRAPHEPQVQRGDVGVADERLGVVAEDVGIEMREQSHGAIPAGAGDNGFHVGVDPHAHETVRAALVLGPGEARQPLDLRVE